MHSKQFTVTMTSFGVTTLFAFFLANCPTTFGESPAAPPAPASPSPAKESSKKTNRFVRIQHAAELSDEGNEDHQSPRIEDEVPAKRTDKLNANGRPIGLQTSILHYSTSDGSQTVDLIGAIHIGERSYYEELNRRFRDYDALLYELVAPKESRIPQKGAAPRSTIGYLQTGMTDMLGLRFQLHEIDYTPENFVHADMTPEEFRASMKRRKESLGKMFFRALGQSVAQQSDRKHQGGEVAMAAAMFADDREQKLRVILANQFADLDGSTLVFGGPDGSTLITERNKKALTVLDSQLKSGQKKIGIFYGAGHLEDMAERLERDFKMHLTKIDWLTAWNLDRNETAE